MFIGNDIPGMVTGLRADDKQSTITLSWNPVSEQGQNGGYVDPEATDYIVWDTRVVNNQIYLNEKVDSVRGITQSTFDYFTEEGDQHLERWAVQTKNDIGTGSAYALELMVGESYPMPIEEHLDGQQTHYYWIYDTMLGQTHLYYSDQASDGDGYAFEQRGLTAGEIGSLSSGKILMGTDLNPTVTLGKQNAPIVAASKPILTFDVKSSSTVNPLVVRILKPDGTFGTDVVLGVPGSEYENMSVDLSQYADLHHVRFLLTGYFDEAGSFYFDNIQVKDDAATGIADVQLSQDGKPANIYTVDGRLVRRNATGTTGLPQGIYIMGNQKVVVI